MKIVPLLYKVKKWTYNAAAPRTNINKECVFIVRPLIGEISREIKGIVITWTLVLTGEGIEILYFSCEDHYQIFQKNLLDAEIVDVLTVSLDYSNRELQMRNAEIKIDVDISGIKFQKKDIQEIRKYFP